MPKPLAIPIAGAVSLGNYETSVLCEVLDATHNHNHNIDPKTTDSNRILIDVLTGASLGGMTAIVLAQKLCELDPILYSGSDIRPIDSHSTIEPA